jgi:transposase
MAKRYSAKFKFQVITDLLTGAKSTAQVAKVYGVQPNTVNAWKRTFLEKGPEIFAQDSLVAEDERRIAELERLIGRKEVEIALLKTSWGGRDDTGPESGIGRERGHDPGTAGLGTGQGDLSGAGYPVCRDDHAPRPRLGLYQLRMDVAVALEGWLAGLVCTAGSQRQS